MDGRAVWWQEFGSQVGDRSLAVVCVNGTSDGLVATMRTLHRVSKKRQVVVEVQAVDAVLEFEMDQRALGRDLFHLICRTIGLRETCYFGLQFFDSKGFVSWLKDDKRLNEQDVAINHRLPASPASTASSTSSVCTATSSSTHSASPNTSSASKPRLVFHFLAKYFPEDVAQELIQEVTQHLFFLQVKQAILNMDIFCPPEAAVLLASYAVQAKYGDYDETNFRPGMLADAEDLLPQRVIDQYQMTPEMWEEKIRVWYADHKDMGRDEAELEYLKIAQDLQMYGVNYFLITNKKDSKLWLGVTPTSLNIYDADNKLSPKISFAWNEIRNISFDDKKFTIKPEDKTAPPFHFQTEKSRMNKIILDLCMGNHELYMRRRQPDSMELQQMKAQAAEERQRRQAERAKLAKEKELREAAERERAELEQKLIECQEDARIAHQKLCQSEELAQLLIQRARVAEEEALLLSHKSREAEAELKRLTDTAIRTEEQKRDAQIHATKVAQQSDKESEFLRIELLKAKTAEKEAKEKLFQLLRAAASVPVDNSGVNNNGLNNNTTFPLPAPPAIQTPVTGTNIFIRGNCQVTNDSNAALINHNYINCFSGQDPVSLTSHSHTGSMHEPHMLHHLHSPAIRAASPMCDSVSFALPSEGLAEGDVEQMALEIEKERMDCREKSRSIQHQLRELKSEIEVLKVEERLTPMDRIHEANTNRGEDKYSTLRKSKAGSTQARVSFFEAL